MQVLYQHLQEITKYPLSNKDIQQLYHIPIIVPSDMSTILQTTPKVGQWVIYLSGPTQIGHWVLLSKGPNGWEYFDSYGKAPPKAVSKYFGKLPYNRIKYQKYGSINTCGFHVLFRAFSQKFMDMDLDQYRAFMKIPRDHDKAVIYYVTNYVSKTI